MVHNKSNLSLQAVQIYQCIHIKFHVVISAMYLTCIFDLKIEILCNLLILRGGSSFLYTKEMLYTAYTPTVMHQSFVTTVLHWLRSCLEKNSLTHCILVDSSTAICWMCPFLILGVLGLFCHFYSIFDGKILLANNVDPDQMPHYVASDLGLHCLPMTLL